MLNEHIPVMQKIDKMNMLIVAAFTFSALMIAPALSRPPKQKRGVGVYYPNASAHDAFQTGAGNFYNDVSYCDARSYYIPNHYYRAAGVLFETITIPQGSNILSANLRVYCWSWTASNPNLKIYAHNVDDSPVFDGSNGRVFTRARTTTYVSWIGDDLGTGYLTISVKDVVQEIIDRPTFTSGNSISLLLIPNNDAHKWLLFYAYGAHLIYPLPDYRPELVVTWN